MVRAALVAALWVGAGCTFTGLGRYEIGRCDAPRAPTSFDDDPCRELGDPTAGCLRYQCDVETGTCQRRALDFDRDGDPSIECGGHDCDDRDGRRKTGGVEICDGADNDCNGIADDALVVALSARSLLALPAGFREPSLTSASGKTLVGAAVIDGAAGPCILAFRGTGEALAPPCTFPAIAGVVPRQPVVRPIVAEDLTFGAVFVTAPRACPQGQIAFRSSKGGALDASCLPSGASLPSFLPYPNGKAIVVAYVGRALDEATGQCAARAAAPLDAMWIDRPTTTAADPPPRVYSQRVALGASVSTRPPALAPLGDTVILAAPADGAVGVWSLRAPRADGSGESVVPLLAPAALQALAGARAVSLALDASSRRLAIVAEIGCSPAQRLVMLIAELTQPGPVLTVAHVVPAAPLAVRASAPSVAWLEERKEWWISWLGEDGKGGALRLRRFDANGLPAGEPMAVSPADGIVLGAPNADAARGATGSIDYFDLQGLAEASLGCR